MILEWKQRLVGGLPIFTSLTEHESKFLAREAAGKRVLEIGSAYGYSAVLMARMGAQVCAIDPHNVLSDGLDRMLQAIRFHRLEGQIDIWRMTSDEAFSKLRAAQREFDLVFIDGDHSHYQVKTDALNAMGVLADTGMLVCHDYGEEQCVGVKQALDEVFPQGADRVIDTLWIKRWPSR